MRTQEQYLEKLKSMRHNIYLDGECIGRDDPRIVKASSAIRMTFSLVDNPEMHDLMTATSHITGKTINRFTHIHQCPEDLLKKQEMTRKICGMCGGCGRNRRRILCRRRLYLRKLDNTSAFRSVECGTGCFFRGNIHRSRIRI